MENKFFITFLDQFIYFINWKFPFFYQLPTIKVCKNENKDFEHFSRLK